MYLDSALNYCSARTTINNYSVRWCLLLFHFSLEANVCAHLALEILRTPEECVLNARAQCKSQLSADSLSCSAVCTLGSCIFPLPPFFLKYIFYTLQQGHPILTHCNPLLMFRNRNNTAKRAERCLEGQLLSQSDHCESEIVPALSMLIIFAWPSIDNVR